VFGGVAALKMAFSTSSIHNQSSRALCRSVTFGLRTPTATQVLQTTRWSEPGRPPPASPSCLPLLPVPLLMVAAGTLVLRSFGVGVLKTANESSADQRDGRRFGPGVTDLCCRRSADAGHPRRFALRRRGHPTLRQINFSRHLVDLPAPFRCFGRITRFRTMGLNASSDRVVGRKSASGRRRSVEVFDGSARPLLSGRFRPAALQRLGDYTPKWIISALATPYPEDLVCKLLLTGYSTCRNRIHNLDVCSRQVLAFYCTAWSLSCPLRRRSFAL
jgi:hypothetical protein